MRILIATDSFPPTIDGVAHTAAMLTRLLGARGHEVRVLAPAPGASELDGCEVTRIPSMPFPAYPQLRLAGPSPALMRALRNRADAAIVLTPGVIGLTATALLPRSTRLINVYTTDIPHYAGTYGAGLLRSPVVRVLRWMSDRADWTLCPTEFVRDELAERGHTRLAVWGCGVDAELFNPSKRDAETRRWLTCGETDKPLVLYVGRLAREKRLLDMCEAARLLPNARFAVVGDGPQREMLERRFAGLPIVFTGFLRGERLAQAFATADVFIFPSESETFGQVVLQAMASGVPPIVVRGTAPAEFVQDGVVGLHVPPRSPGAIAGAISQLIGDVELRQSMAAAAHREGRRYSWESLVDDLESRLDQGSIPPLPHDRLRLRDGWVVNRRLKGREEHVHDDARRRSRPKQLV